LSLQGESASNLIVVIVEPGHFLAPRPSPEPQAVVITNLSYIEMDVSMVMRRRMPAWLFFGLWNDADLDMPI
jgi:hypothetical protein